MGRWRIDRITGPPAPLRDGRGHPVAARCHVARGALARAVGLLGTADLRADEALWLPGCRSVHTLGMRMAIDVALLDPGGRVLAVARGVPPGRLVARRGARAVVEAPAGALAGVAAGDRLVTTDTPACDSSATCGHPRG